MTGDICKSKIHISRLFSGFLYSISAYSINELVRICNAKRWIDSGCSGEMGDEEREETCDQTAFRSKASYK